MGQFKVEIIGVGGHGVDRDKKDGEDVDFHKEGPYSPDAIASRFMQELKYSGVNVESAKIVHWPGTESEITDDLLTKKRKGNF